MDNVAEAAEAYKGTASIIQGALIAISAVVALCGYYLKSKLDRKERNRQLALQQLSKQLDELVGPAQALSYGGLMARINFVQAVAWPGEFGDTFADTTNSEHFFFGGGGKLGAKCRTLVHNFTSAGAIQLWSFVGKEKEDEMLADPEGALAVEYRRFIRRIVRFYYRPLSDLLIQTMNSMPLPEKGEFKKSYAGATGSVALRKLFFLQCIAWTDEMQCVIENEWDHGDFRKLWPVSSPFPYKLCQYLAGMLTQLKADIANLTSNVLSANSNDKDNNVGETNTKTSSNRSSSSSTNSSHSSSSHSTKTGGGGSASATLRQRKIASGEKSADGTVITVQGSEKTNISRSSYLVAATSATAIAAAAAVTGSV